VKPPKRRPQRALPPSAASQRSLLVSPHPERPLKQRAASFPPARKIGRAVLHATGTHDREATKLTPPVAVRVRPLGMDRRPCTAGTVRTRKSSKRVEERKAHEPKI
jgi:hypothetical protein